MSVRDIPKRHRVFFALWPDEETAEHLHSLGHNLVVPTSAPSGRAHRGHRGNGRVTSERNMHLTLAFVGSVSDETLKDLEDAVDHSRFFACDVRLDKLGFWPRGGVVYAGCNCAPASTAVKALMRQLGDLVAAVGLPRDHRPLAPHVTLARNVRGIELPRLGTVFSWHARSLALVRSELRPSGACYETIAEWPLGESAEALDE